jgi:hypothetical protein
MAKYTARFVDGPLQGKTQKIEVLFSTLTKHPEGGGPAVSYYRKDDPGQRLKEYRYSVRP